MENESKKKWNAAMAYRDKLENLGYTTSQRQTLGYGFRDGWEAAMKAIEEEKEV